MAKRGQPIVRASHVYLYIIASLFSPLKTGFFIVNEVL